MTMKKKKLGFKIIQDHLNIEDIPSKEGKSYNNFEESDDDYLCRAYDDNGILYYTAQCNSEDAAEIFHDWSANDSGTTFTDIKKNNAIEKWIPFIG